MKVIQINVTYNQGSTGRLTADIHQFLIRHGVDSFVIYGFGDSHDDPFVKRAAPEIIRKCQSLRSRITGYAYEGCWISTRRILKMLDAEKPDVVHLQCINGYMVNICKLLSYLKEEQIPTVMTLHAEFPYTTGCSHAVNCEKWKTGCHHCGEAGNTRPASWFFDRSQSEWLRFKKAYDGFKHLYVCGVSDWVTNRCTESPFYSNARIATVMNGINTDVFYYRKSSEHRNRFADEHEKIILHVTPNFSEPVKGGIHVIEMARRFPNVKFVVVGDDGAGHEFPSNLTFIAHTENQDELACYYSMADLTLLTSVRETFSMVCAESLCCGTPVVGFRAGAPESIAIPQYSSFSEQGNDDALAEEISFWLSRSFTHEEVSREAINRYSTERMCSQYYDIYCSAVKEEPKR